MATRELITKIGRNLYFSSRGFNVAAPVGTKGTNDKGDVMLVQALLKFIVIGTPKKMIRNAPLIKDVNGYFNPETGLAIRWFQKEFSTMLISKDGLVNPATFKNRNIKLGGKQMTIYELNYYALRASVLYSETVDYTEAMFKEFPQLKLWVKDV